MDDTSELLSGGDSKIVQDDNTNSNIAKISYLKAPLQSSQKDDCFFSQVTQVKDLKNALDRLNLNAITNAEDEKRNALTAFYK